jgi:hypothetical protein
MILAFVKSRRAAYTTFLRFILFSGILTSCAKATSLPEPVSLTEVVAADETQVSATEFSGEGTGVWQEPTAGIPTVAYHTGLGLAIFASNNFVGSGNCAVCHSNLSDQAGNDVSMDSHWRSAMMANSARDPFWQAKVSSEVTRNPELGDVIEDKCANCHTPMVHTETSAMGESTSLLENGVLQQENLQHIPAMDGVSCTVCHQIQDVDLGQEASFSGGYVIDTDAVSPDRPIFGPYEDQFQQLMINTVGYTPVYGAQVLVAGLCATCHTLYTPYVDASGAVLGEFPEQTPYFEWENSIYGDGVDEDRICQSCHMPAAEGAVVISNMPQGRQLTPRSPFVQHHFVGGNAFMLKILQGRVEELALTASTDHFAATLGRTQNQLQNNTAKISIIDSTIEGDLAMILVKIENLAGHKFPTGFPSRRAWIHLTLTDSTGKIVFESGKPGNDGSIEGDDADENIQNYEPHYDAISNPGQVQIFQAIMENSDGEITYTLLRAARYAKDNRLLPAGFDKNDVDGDIAVYGAAVADGNFTGGSDQVQYQIEIEGHSGPFLVTVELLYQSISASFVQDLSEDETDMVDRFMGFLDTADRSPVVISMVQVTIE